MGMLLQLNVVVQQPDLLARLERGQPDVGTAVTPESIPKRAVPAAANFPRHSEVDLGQVVKLQLWCRWSCCAVCAVGRAVAV